MHACMHDSGPGPGHQAITVDSTYQLFHPIAMNPGLRVDMP